MSKASAAAKTSLWILRVLMAALFLFAAVAKLTGQPAMIADFAHIGLGQWFRYFTGATEVIGGITLLIPHYSPFGAIVLLAVDVGAFVAQVGVLHQDWIHTVVIALILGAVLYLQRDAFAAPRSAPASQ